MDYYNDDEYLQEEFFYDDEKNSYMNYLLCQKRKRKEKFLQNNIYRDEYLRDFNEDLPYDDR